MQKKSPALSSYSNYRRSTPRDVALRYGVSAPTIYKEINSGRLQAKKLGKRTVITPEAEKNWIDSLPNYVDEKSAQ